MKKRSQIERIKNALMNGEKITPLDAWISYGVYRISDVVFRLRKAGYDVQTKMVEVQNQWGETCKVAQYFIEVEK